MEMMSILLIYLNQTMQTKLAIICEMEFKNSRTKKKHMFLLHKGQTGGNRGRNLPINILRRGPKTDFSISFD